MSKKFWKKSLVNRLLYSNYFGTFQKIIAQEDLVFSIFQKYFKYCKIYRTKFKVNSTNLFSTMIFVKPNNVLHV